MAFGDIRAVALDVDGVLTNGTFIWGSGGEDFKQFSFLDVMGISQGIKAGLVFALISGEDSPLVDRFAQKMGILDVHKGCKDKALALRTFARRYELTMEQVCMMGDDVNDVPAMEIAGLAVAPPGAHESARRVAAIVTECRGGHGAVRELVDHLLSSRGEEGRP